MGIKDLTPLIKEHSSRSCRTVPLSSFSSFLITIDIDVLIHKFYGIFYKKLSGNINPLTQNIDEEKLIQQINTCIYDHLNNYFFSNGIKVLIVFSGSAPPEKDKYARKIRDNVKLRAQERLACARENYASLTDEEYMKLGFSIIEEHTKIKQAASRLPSKLWSSLKTFLEGKQVPCITAINEAEELCAALCLEDIAQAVYSTDTDNIVRRCSVLITKVEVVKGLKVANIITYDDYLLKDMGLSYPQFFDLCILLGCDYNKRISGNGVVECYRKILKYGSIESIMKAEPEKDWENVNYVRCKEIFNFNHIRSAAECSADDLSLLLI